MAKFPLDIGDTIEESLVFWYTRFFTHKAEALNKDGIKNDALYEECLNALAASPSSLEEIHKIVNNMKRAGFGGPSVYIKPLLLFATMIVKSRLESLKEIDSDFMTSFLSRATHGMSDATVNNYKNATLNFLSYLSSSNENEPNSGNGYIFSVKIGKINGVSSSTKKIPEYMTKKEMDKFLEVLEGYEFGRNKDAQIIFRLIIKLILFTGARVNEMVSLNKKDISFDDNGVVIKLKGKGKKYRVVSIANRNVKEDLDLYLKHTYPLCKNGRLFCGIINHEIDLNTRQVSKAVEQVLDFAKINKQKSGAHLLRHTYATYVYNQTRDLRLVQELLGHADSKTTQIYTHIDEERIKKVMDIFK